MANFFPCPNSGCTYQFDADQLPPAAMVTCPLCRTRFPYRAAQPAPAETAAGGDNPFGGAGSAGGEMRSSSNRLVNPRYVPKDSKSQSIIMLVGFTVVVAAVLLIIMITMRKNPFASSGGSSETFTNDEFNYKFRKFNKDVWTEDRGLQTRMGVSGFVWRRADPDAWVGLHAKDYLKDSKKSPRPTEMRELMIGMLKKVMKSMGPPESFKPTVAGVAADGIRFQGEYDGKQVTGEGFAFHNNGIGYILLYFAANDSWDAAKKELDEIMKSFEFGGGKDKRKESEGPIERYYIEGENYELADVDAAWQRAFEPSADGTRPKKTDYVVEKLTDKDPKATMAFRLKGIKVRPVPEAVVVVLPQANDPLDAARAYWLKHVEEDEGRNGEVKITLDPLKKSPSGMAIPQSEANVGIFEMLNGEDSKAKRFFAIAALNIGDKLVAAIAWCPDREADVLEPKMLNFVSTLHERK